jgi:hypothetical protein
MIVEGRDVLAAVETQRLLSPVLDENNNNCWSLAVRLVLLFGFGPLEGC